MSSQSMMITSHARDADDPEAQAKSAAAWAAPGSASRFCLQSPVSESVSEDSELPSELPHSDWAWELEEESVFWSL